MRFAIVSSTMPLLCALVSAQSVVTPALFTNAEAPSQNTHPIGPTVTTSPSMRYQQVHDDVTQAGNIREMAFRLTAGNTGQPTLITMEVLLSTAVTTSATSVTTFDNNHGVDRMTVVPANSQFNFPAVTPTPRGPAPFVYRVPFTTMFPFAGSGSLCWELRIASRTNTTAFSPDAASGVLGLITQAVGTGCLATGRTIVATTTATLSASNLTVSAANLASSSIGLAVVGFSDRLWLGVPLPILIPGSDVGPSGPCNVWSSIDLLQAFNTSTTGAGSSVFAAVPASTAWAGLRAFSWAMCLDATANATGIVSTNYRELTWGTGAASPATRVYAVNNVNAVTGTRDSTGVVVELVY